MATMAQNIEVNPRGIPRAPFVSNVESFIGASTVEETMKKFDEMTGKYKFMETSLRTRKRSLESKIPDIEKTLTVVKTLSKRQESKEPLAVDFELNDTLFASGEIEQFDKVCLWLGANVMLEYPVDEAQTLLTNKLAAAKKSLEQTTEDLDFLREQITTMEVNVARVYNWDVKRRRSQGPSQ